MAPDRITSSGVAMAVFRRDFIIFDVGGNFQVQIALRKGRGVDFLVFFFECLDILFFISCQNDKNGKTNDKYD